MTTIERMTKAEATVSAPSSKAHTLRALFLAALAEGQSTIHRPLLGDDQRRAIECLCRLGVGIRAEQGHLIVDGVLTSCREPNRLRFRPSTSELDVGESGVTMNFMVAMACLSDRPITLTGAPRITERPISEIVDGLRQLGCRMDYRVRDGFPPIEVHGGGIPGGTARIRGDITSQYFSGIMAAAPYAESTIHLKCEGGMCEKPYLEITMAMMADFGVSVNNDRFRSLSAPNTRGYRAREIRIEGDYSSAAFFFEAAAICRNRVTVTGLNPKSLQGDRRFLSLLQEMGCSVSWSRDSVTVEGRPLRAIEADMADTPDLVVPLAIVAAFANGTSCLRNVVHLRHKECDRLSVTVSELAKMGVQASCDQSSLTVRGGCRPYGSKIDPHNDHRIAMSFAVAGLATGNQLIENEICVAKSFPDFWERLEYLSD